MNADKKTEGAWIIHHSNKLQTVAGAVEFQEIEFAGKCGLLLSALAADQQTSLDKNKVDAIAKAAKLSIYTDLPAILGKLEEQQLIDQSDGNVEVLGLTTATVLRHTADIFHSTQPSEQEKAALLMAEETSRAPVIEKNLAEKLADTHKLDTSTLRSLLQQSVTIGFVDTQPLDANTKLYFNGNLFRVENAKKCEAILLSLTPTDRSNMDTLEQKLLRKGCIEESDARKLLGNVLFDKLHSIGIFDVGSVSNDKETVYYVTRPGAFGKYGNTVAEDALDLAKALVASLTYGMTKSVHSRGRIRLLNLLLDKLIRGQWLNPSTAAGQDYKILELKRVVELRHAKGSQFQMRLLKREVGIHAKKILNFGDTSEDSLPAMPGASVTSYQGPETNRTVKRKKMTELDKATTAALLNDIRTGGLR
jgi:hypothetical protein